jgi:hypothetical protein
MAKQNKRSKKAKSIWDNNPILDRTVFRNYKPKPPRGRALEAPPKPAPETPKGTIPLFTIDNMVAVGSDGKRRSYFGATTPDALTTKLRQWLEINGDRLRAGERPELPATEKGSKVIVQYENFPRDYYGGPDHWMNFKRIRTGQTDTQVARIGDERTPIQPGDVGSVEWLDQAIDIYLEDPSIINSKNRVKFEKTFRRPVSPDVPVTNFTEPYQRQSTTPEPKRQSQQPLRIEQPAQPQQQVQPQPQPQPQVQQTPTQPLRIEPPAQPLAPEPTTQPTGVQLTPDAPVSVKVWF